KPPPAPLSKGTGFRDNGEISPWAAGSVAVAVANGVIEGYPDGTFRPWGNTTRAEAVTVIAGTLK
ncbi:MAG: S-layer homology domain-containing protein, partial [Eubacteriales bacterium]